LVANCGEASVGASTLVPSNVMPSMFTISGVMSTWTVVEHADPEHVFGSDPTML
jgi:hypothetical protein